MFEEDTGFTLREESQIRDDILYYQNLGDILTSPTLQTFKSGLQESIDTTKQNIANKLLKKSLTRNQMLDIIDEVIEAKGIISSVEAILDKLNPQTVKDQIRYLEAELALSVKNYGNNNDDDEQYI